MKDGKIFGKINIIDLMIVVVIIAAVIGIISRISVSSSSNISGNDQFRFVVRIDSVRDYTVKGLEKKGEVFSEENNVHVGEIVDVKAEPMKADIVTFDGQRKFVERPGRYTVYVTVKADGNLVNGGYYTKDKEEIGAGREYRLITKYVSTKGDTISVSGLE